MNEKLNIEERVLELVMSENYQPLKPKAIAKKLKLLEIEREVKRVIKKMTRKGKLGYGPKHLVTKPQTSDTSSNSSSRSRTGLPKPSGSSKPSGKKKADKKKGLITGTFRKVSGGFGFVSPSDSTVTDRSEDIFIPRSKTSDAANLDIVSVRLSKPKDKTEKRNSGRNNRISGKIVEVIKRYRYRFVGTYTEVGNFGIVNVDGGVFESGILVGDAGAKACKVGDKVVIELANFPSNHTEGEGVIVQVLGERGQPGVDTQMVIHEFGLPQEFPEEVLADARVQSEKFEEIIGPDRTDFTNTTVATIDPKTARDFDDAIGLERIENGHWKLAVHIADVSHFVPYRSDLDNEAFARGTSVYLPDKVIPMLPEIISNNLASLQPNRVRYCMTAIIEFSAEGIPIATDLHRGAIKSAHRFNYEEIDDYLENDKPWKKKLTPEIFQLVRDMHTLAMILRKRRMAAGSINLVLPEVEIDLDEDGKVSGAHTNENTESHQVIEEFMLAANEAVAQRMVEEGLYLMRRIHEQPSEQKTTELTKFVQQLGIECGDLQNRFELKKVIEASEGMPEQHAIHFAILRSMQKAIYSPKEVGHYALSSDAYCHFTSPIRRYPDLIIHRMVGDLIDGKRPRSDFDRLAQAGKHCSDLEKRASDAERELKKLKLLSFMSDKVGEKLTAVITGVESFGLFAQGIEIPAEGLIPIGNLPNDQYVFDRASRTLSGYKATNQFRLGDTVEVIVSLVDLDQRIMEYKFTGARPQKPGKGKGKSGGRREKAIIARSDKDKSRSNKSDTKLTAKKKSAGKSKTKADSKKSDARKSSESKPATRTEKTKTKDKVKAKSKNKRKSNAKKRKDPDASWEEVRKEGTTRAQREQKKKAKKKKSYGRVMVESKKSKKKQAARKKAKAKAKKAQRKAKVAKAKKKAKKKPGSRKRKK